MACALVVFPSAAATQADPLPAAGSCWPGEPGSDPRLCPPDDPSYRDHWEFLSFIPDSVDQQRMHPRERELGSIGISLDRAWQHTTGREDVVIAVLDSGIRWNYEDLTRKLYLNPGELPLPEGATVHDRNGDGVFDIGDYAGDSRVSDLNRNGLTDPGDLILTFSDCRDDDGNGYTDDISGYDFFSGTHCGSRPGDNDPHDETDFGHGTGIASTAAAETNNGIDDVGVCPRCRVLPVRVGDSFVVDANRFARGVVFAVNAGASVIASATGSYNNTPAARFAIDYAYRRGVPVVASAADEFSYHHNYPSVYNHTLYVNAIRFNHAKRYEKASTFWGVNPCTNFGARVSVTMPATTCSSGATARLAGVLGLVQSMARDAGIDDLQAEEVYQLLHGTADDLDNSSPNWGRRRFPAKPGFDQLYGYGRVNVLAAVRAVADNRIPPIVDLDNPRWFAVVSPILTPRLAIHGTIDSPRARRAEYVLEYALGVEPGETDYVRVASGAVSGSRTGYLGALDFARLPIPSGPGPTNRDERDRYSVTLRLRATDERGLRAEARRSFFVFHDPSWMPQFPVDLGVSGEASPTLVDLDGDGRDEIVLPTADGRLNIARWAADGLDTRSALLDRGPAIDPTGGTTHQVDTLMRGETVIRGAAVGDLFGDGKPWIVVASREGKVYVFDAEGRRRQPFPVAVSGEANVTASPSRKIEQGILSRPVLAELDGRPGMEIVVSALDGRVYVWSNDGALLDGFPVSIERPAAAGRRSARIVSTPAVGDIDGDGEPELVVGSNLVEDHLSAAWAIRSRGSAHDGGAFVPGWEPFRLSAVRPRLLPTLASGVQMDPLLVDADGDGDQEVILYAVTSNSIVLVDQAGGESPKIVARFSMSPGGESEFRRTSFLAGTGSALLEDTDGDGGLELYAPLLPFRMLTLRSKPGIPLDLAPALGGWPLVVGPDPASVLPMIENYPRRMEDLMILSRPVAADVDGDGIKEVLMSSGGYLLHAFQRGGGEAEGFPKFTGGWMLSEPAIGDLDGDGRLELVAVTREGYLFAWALGPTPPRAVSATGSPNRITR